MIYDWNNGMGTFCYQACDVKICLILVTVLQIYLNIYVLKSMYSWSKSEGLGDE
jgi:hypothetical protein